VQLIQQLDEELGIEKFRMELESTQVLVRAVAVLRGMMLRAAGPATVPTQVVCKWQLRSIARHHQDLHAGHARGSLWLLCPTTFTADSRIDRCLPSSGVTQLLLLQSDANEKLNELEEQLQQIKDQIKVRRYAASLCAPVEVTHHQHL
jgi:hypothetical protein